MTDLLTKAFKEAQKLPEKSPDVLAAFADKAREEYRAGRTKEMGFDEL